MIILNRKVKFSIIPVLSAVIVFGFSVLAGLYFSSEQAKQMENIVVGEDNAEPNSLQLYNSGVIKFKNGELEETSNLWRDALAKEEIPPRVRFYLFFNSGVMTFHFAQDEKTAKLEDKIRLARKSIHYFRDSLEYVDQASDTEEALSLIRKNIEIAKRYLVSLFEQEKQSEDQKKEETPLEIINKLIEEEQEIRRQLSEVSLLDDDGEKERKVKSLASKRERTLGLLQNLSTPADQQNSGQSANTPSLIPIK